MIFLILSTGFVVSLLWALLQMMNKDWGQEPFSGKSVISLFKFPLFFFICFALFVMWILPIMEN